MLLVQVQQFRTGTRYGLITPVWQKVLENNSNVCQVAGEKQVVEPFFPLPFLNRFNDKNRQNKEKYSGPTWNAETFTRRKCENHKNSRKILYNLRNIFIAQVFGIQFHAINVRDFF